MPNKNEDATTEKQSLLELAKKRFDLAVEAETEQRKLALEDLKFRAGEQWPQQIKSDRASENKPCLTINKIVQACHQVTNDQRQNRPSIKVSPASDEASQETAEVFQGLIRHIENVSHADTAYDTAFESTVHSGIGYFRIVTDYCDPESFDQEIFIKRIRNPLTVYLDPHYQEPDGSDAGWGFVFETMSKDEFKNQFPDAKLSTMEDWQSLGDKAPGWVQKDSVRVAEYFYKTYKKVEIVQLSDGTVIPRDQLAKVKLPPEITEVKSRETTLPAIKWAKINGIETLDETDWLGQWIPIVPIVGDELDIDGKVTREGLIRHAKDPQRMYNYFASTEAEVIALAPKAPFIGAEGQFKGYETQWKNANRKNMPYLEYVPKALNGTPVGPPQRTPSDSNVGAITNARELASEDLKTTTGIYDATLGNRSNEQSGLAIQRRNSQAQTSNYHFIDNLARSLRHAGRILVDLIPKIYDTPRIGRIVKEDGTAEMVPLNQQYEQNGKPMEHDLSKGKYDVVIGTGPSYETKRQEAQNSMIEFSKALPQTAPLISDLIARNSDWPGAQEIADRLKKTLPPGVVDEKDQQQPIPQQVKQTLDQQAQMIQQLSQHLHAAQDELDQKTRELASKERIALTQVQAQIEIALAKMQSESAQTLLTHQVGEIEQRLDMVGEHAALSLQAQDQQAQQQQAQQQMQAQPQSQQNPTGGQPGQSMEQP